MNSYTFDLDRETLATPTVRQAISDYLDGWKETRARRLELRSRCGPEWDLHTKTVWLSQMDTALQRAGVDDEVRVAVIREVAGCSRDSR